jgi:hypothetical protein
MSSAITLVTSHAHAGLDLITLDESGKITKFEVRPPLPTIQSFVQAATMETHQKKKRLHRVRGQI